MAYCPECNNPIDGKAQSCPHCGKRIIPADKLENVQTRMSFGQKVFIGISIIILIIIGFTYQGAETREDKAAQAIFTAPVSALAKNMTEATGIASEFGYPRCTLNALTNAATVNLEFQKGPLSPLQAKILGQGVAGGLARTYVRKGYQPTNITVNISSYLPGGKKVNYGSAIFDGNTNVMYWKNTTK